MGSIRVGGRQFLWGWENERAKARRQYAKSRAKPLSHTPTARYVEAEATDNHGVIVSWNSGDSGANTWVPYIVEYKRGRLDRWRNVGSSDRHFGRYLVSGLKPERNYKFRVRASGRGPELGRDLAQAI